VGSLGGGVGDEPYIEQSANVALAIDESLVQDYDGVLRIAPALPPGWDGDGTQYIQGGSTVSVQVHGGVIGTVGVNAGSTGTLTVRNPWPGQQVEVVDGGDESTVVAGPTSDDQFDVPIVAGDSYLIQPVTAPVSAMSYAPVTGTPATSASHLGGVQIGLDAASGTGQITGIYGLCVDVTGGSNANGTAVEVWDCNGGSNQQWTVGADGTLRSLGKCMEAAGGATSPGTPIELDDCNGTGSQVWRAQSGAELVNPQSGRCLDDSGAGGAGTQLIIWTCTDAANQQWKLP
jgi:hypothetical protein